MKMSNKFLDIYIQELIERMKHALRRVQYDLDYKVTLEHTPERRIGLFRKPHREWLELWFTFTAPTGSTLTTTMIVSDKKKENIRGLILNFMYVILPRLGEGYYSMNKEYSITFRLPNTQKQIKIMFDDNADKLTILVGGFQEEPISLAEISVYDVFDVLIDIVELIKLVVKEV